MHCASCMKYIGPGPDIYRELESCGDPECDREVRDMYRQMDDNARADAEDDGFSRYR